MPNFDVWYVWEEVCRIISNKYPTRNFVKPDQKDFPGYLGNCEYFFFPIPHNRLKANFNVYLIDGLKYVSEYNLKTMLLNLEMKLEEFDSAIVRNLTP